MARFKTYTSDKILVNNKSGFVSKDEWAKSRIFNYEYLRTRKNSDFFDYIFQFETSKLKDASELCKICNFDKNLRFLDLGGFPFIQSLVIKNKNPSLKFLLTDFDEESLSNLKDIEIFKNQDFELKSFDLKSDSLDILKDNFDVITMWGVDYILEDENLISLFNFIKKEGQKRNIKLLIASIRCDDIKVNIPHVGKYINNFINIIRRFNKNFKPLLVSKLKNKKLRFHGYLRTPETFKNISKICSCQCKLILKTNHYNIFEIN